MNLKINTMSKQLKYIKSKNIYFTINNNTITEVLKPAKEFCKSLSLIKIKNQYYYTTPITNRNLHHYTKYFKNIM